MNNMLRRFVTAVDNYPFSMAVATVGTTTMTGVVVMKATDRNPYVEQRRPLSTREAHFRAMVEDAKESSWRENLETAAMAQEQSMMTHGNNADPVALSRFLTKIDARSRKLLSEDQEYWQQKKEHENREKAFATTTIW